MLDNFNPAPNEHTKPTRNKVKPKPLANPQETLKTNLKITALQQRTSILFKSILGKPYQHPSSNKNKTTRRTNFETPYARHSDVLSIGTHAC